MAAPTAVAIEAGFLPLEGSTKITVTAPVDVNNTAITGATVTYKVFPQSEWEKEEASSGTGTPVTGLTGTLSASGADYTANVDIPAPPTMTVMGAYVVYVKLVATGITSHVWTGQTIARYPDSAGG